MSPWDYTFKIVVLGDVSSGKEELMKKYASIYFQEREGLSIGVKFYRKTISTIRMQLWVISEEARWQYLLPTYYLGCNGTIIMYDITDSNSLKHVPEWVQLIKQKSGSIPILLVGNNLEQNREVSSEQIERLKEQYDISSSMEISVKTGENVEKMFATIITEMIYYHDFPRNLLELITQEEKDKRVQEFYDENIIFSQKAEFSQEEKDKIRKSTLATIDKNTLKEKDDEILQLEKEIELLNDELAKADKDLEQELIEKLENPPINFKKFPEPITEPLDDILKKLLNVIPEVKAAMIVSTEGLPIASALPQGLDETRMAAIIAPLLSLAERAVIEMKKGEFDQLYIKSSEGNLLVLHAGPNAVLTVSTTKDAGLGLIFHYLKRNLGDSDFFPYPYIFKPPSPPGDAGAEAKLKPEYIVSKKESESTLNCKHCGAPLAKGESICHVCGKKTV